ncbi:MAG: hypothetical protein HC769_32355 [Cyanobacteria bacterium CRU_2_1]|nr:hypothetical protein [Cyanobacteria bacterium CRU_2_1]
MRAILDEKIIGSIFHGIVVIGFVAIAFLATQYQIPFAWLLLALPYLYLAYGVKLLERLTSRNSEARILSPLEKKLNSIRLSMSVVTEFCAALGIIAFLFLIVVQDENISKLDDMSSIGLDDKSLEALEVRVTYISRFAMLGLLLIFFTFSWLISRLATELGKLSQVASDFVRNQDADDSAL